MTASGRLRLSREPAPAVEGEPAVRYSMEDPGWIDEVRESGRTRHRGGCFRTPDGIVFRVNFRTPLRICQLMIDRTLPGEDRPAGYMFQRNGRVNPGGARKVPLGEAVASGHEPWPTRAELEELASQLRRAVP